jgi:hypothetical protein
MEDVLHTRDQETTILKALEGMPVTEAKLLLRRIASNTELATKASAPPSPQRRSLWKVLFSLPYSRETMDSLMAFVGVLMSLLAFVFVLTLCIEHFYHLFRKN